MPNVFKLAIKPSELAKFNRRADRIVKSTRNKVIKKAVRETMKPLVGEARSRAPRGKTGMLKKAIKLKVVTYRRNEIVDGIVGVSRIEKDFNGKKVRPSYYAHLVEYGTGPKSAKNALLMSDGEMVYGKNAKGSAPQPFLRPTFDGNKVTMESRMREKLKAGIESVARSVSV